MNFWDDFHILRLNEYQLYGKMAKANKMSYYMVQHP